MIISPPFLPESGSTASDASKPDPMMDFVDGFEVFHGVYPVAFDRRGHCGLHLTPDFNGPVYAVADGEVVAYRVCQHAVDSGDSHVGFVLLKHSTETGEGRTLTFYSLYMHLLPLSEYHEYGYSTKQMPEFLHMPSGRVAAGQVTPAVPGGGKKVRRKDVLGFLGRYQGTTHLHFEIFMTPGDFETYFTRTQIGNPSPVTPGTTDCWGHVYFTIPADQVFRTLPPGTDAANKLRGIDFGPGRAGSNALPLVVEMYFSKGTKYTNVWTIADDGTRTLLTPEPVPEADYEYDLYSRATALYPRCPSDGYELLRFGRILSADRTLSDAECTTWVKVTYAAGQQGYIDISNAPIGKLSDADFPFFMGWQKISEGNTPFDRDGMCDIDLLKKLLKHPHADHEMLEEPQTTEAAKAKVLSHYVTCNDPVRRQLRGFVCEAPSEWDSTHNEARYRKLLAEGAFYHGNEQGYNNFLKWLKEVQFWDATGLPAGGKLWFFHPLAFIRHFRRCGWLSEDEMLQLVPNNVIRKPGSHSSFGQGVWEAPSIHTAKILIGACREDLNTSLRKFGVDTPIRQACFFANATQETAWFRHLKEGNLADDSTSLHDGWFGRGFLQLTNPNGNMSNGNNNYYKYFRFLGRQPVMPPGQTEIQWRNKVGTDSFHASHSACAYWVWPGKSAPTQANPNLPTVGNANRYADTPSINQRRTIQTNAGMKVWYYNQSFANCAAAVNFPGATGRSPPNMNGLVDRSTSFVNALVVLLDVHVFRDTHGNEWTWPEDFTRRAMA